MSEKDFSLFRVLAPVGDDSNTALDNLSGVAFTVKLSKTNPFTKLLGVRNLDEGNLVLLIVAKSLNELDVGLLGDGVAKNSENGTAGRKGLGSGSKTTGKTVVGKRDLESTLEGFFNRHLSGGRGFDLNDLLGFNLFNVRHF